MSGDDNLAVQILKADIKAFAGNDSVVVGGSFVSSTVAAGAGSDTLFVNATSGSTNASSEFYAGAGDDFISAMNGQSIAIYADASASDTLGGNDSLTINGLTSSSVYGAAGGDTLIVSGGITNRFDLGNGTNFATGAGSYESSTLLGGSGVDKLYINGSTLGYFDAGAGADSVVFNGVVKGTNTTTMTTVLGGAGADTLDFNSSIQYATILGGDAANRIDAGSTVDESTLRGGSGADSLIVTGKGTSALLAGGAAADIFTITTGHTGSSIYAGAGNDSVDFGGAGTRGANNTYYFGASDGKDTLSFGSFTAGTGLTIAVDAAYGATSAFIWSAGSFASGAATLGTMNMGSGGDGVLYLSGVTGTSTGAAGTGIGNISFVTVSTATITALG